MSANNSFTSILGGYAHHDEDQVGQHLQADPLVAAEKVTGKSYKDDEATSALGFLMAIDHNERKSAILRAAHDTTYGMTAEEYLGVALDLGFELVDHRPFEYKGYGSDEPVTLWHCTWVHPEGVVLDYDTYTWGADREQTINGGKFYYNWKPNARYNEAMDAAHKAYSEAESDEEYEAARRLGPPHVTSSGHFAHEDHEPAYLDNPDYDPAKLDYDDPSTFARLENPAWSNDKLVWIGDHDCREGLRYHFNQLREWGDFVKPWVELPWMNLKDLVQAKAYYAKDERDTRPWDDFETWPPEVLEIVGDAARRERAIRKERNA